MENDNLEKDREWLNGDAVTLIIAICNLHVVNTCSS